MALSTSVQVNFNAVHAAAVGDFSSVVDNIVKNYALALATGTAAGAADQVWSDQRTLAASATEDLDLAGVLIDAFGTTLTFVKLKMLLVFAATGNTNNVQVTRPASNGVPFFLAAGDGYAIKPGGMLFLFDPAGVTVTAATGDLITVTNSAGTTGVTYDVFIIGTSA